MGLADIIEEREKPESEELTKEVVLKLGSDFDKLI